MEIQTITTALTAVGTGIGTCITVTWLAKLLIQRFLKTNDEKHILNAAATATVSKNTSLALEKINDTLTEMKVQLATLNTSLGQVIALKERIESDHDKIVALNEWNGKYKGDLAKQWDRVRECEETVEKFGEDITIFIKNFRLEASNE